MTTKMLVFHSLIIKILSVSHFLISILLLILFVWIKIPFILYNGQINPDESQILTQAITLRVDPIFWRSVDGTTSGPINSYLILALTYIGFPFNYITLHSVSVGLIIIFLVINYFTLKLFVNAKASFVSLLIIYSFLLLTDHKDFNHYNSELPSVVLLSLCIFLLARIYLFANISLWPYGVLGMVACLVPLAKIQGGPLAFLYILCGAFIAISSKIHITRKYVLLTALGFGVFTILSLLMWYLYVNEILCDFYIMYIKTNLSHYSPGHSGALFLKLLFKSSYDYLYFLLFNFLIWSSGLLITYRKNRKLFFYDKIFWFFIVNILISFLVVARTGYIFEHYLFYTFLPIILLTGYALNQVLATVATKVSPHLLFIIIIFLLFSGSAITIGLKQTRKNQKFRATLAPIYEIETIKLIRKYVKPTDYLVVWGWNLTYNVITGLPQGTRENHSIRCMNTNSLGAIHDPQLIDYYCRQYVNDIRQHRPAVFIDEVRANSFFKHPSQVVHQSIPALGKLIHDNYKLVSSNSGVLVYVRNDRFKAI